MSEKIEMPSSDYCAKKTVNIVSLEDFSLSYTSCSAENRRLAHLVGYCNVPIRGFLASTMELSIGRKPLQPHALRFMHFGGHSTTIRLPIAI